MLSLIFIRYRNNFLILKRPDGALSFAGLWETISTSDTMSTAELREFVAEILGITTDHISSLREINFIQKGDTVEGKRYFLADLGMPFIELGQEYTAYEWIKPRGAETYKTVPGLAEDIEKVKNY